MHKYLIAPLIILSLALLTIACAAFYVRSLYNDIGYHLSRIPSAAHSPDEYQDIANNPDLYERLLGYKDAGKTAHHVARLKELHYARLEIYTFPHLTRIKSADDPVPPDDFFYQFIKDQDIITAWTSGASLYRKDEYYPFHIEILATDAAHKAIEHRYLDILQANKTNKVKPGH